MQSTNTNKCGVRNAAFSTKDVAAERESDRPMPVIARRILSIDPEQGDSEPIPSGTSSTSMGESEVAGKTAAAGIKTSAETRKLTHERNKRRGWRNAALFILRVMTTVGAILLIAFGTLLGWAVWTAWHEQQRVEFIEQDQHDLFAPPPDAFDIPVPARKGR